MRRSILLTTDQFAYVGSYGTLTGFIRRCRSNGCAQLTDAEMGLLLTCVEDLSRQGTGQAVNRKQEHFQDCDTAFENLLPALGIEVEVGKTRTVKDKEPSRCRMPTVHLDFEAEKVLGDMDFDQRSRQDVALDVHMLAYAFGTPHDLISRYCLDSVALKNWIQTIADKYIDNPYHNWRHAVDVFQFSYLMLVNGAAHKYLNHQDVMALFIAEIGHDVGHLGTNNGFLVRTGHDLAITYNDQAVLENMHCAVLFRTMRQEEGCNVLQPLPEKEYNNTREKIIAAVLATDMSKHFEFVDRFAGRLSQVESNPFQEDTKSSRDKQKASKADRRMLMQAFIHMADLGHCCRPWSIHKHLVVALEEEFFLQGDKERSLGLPCMPMMDRQKDSTAASQEFFMSKLVMPLLTPCATFMTPQVGQFFLNGLSANMLRWKELVARYGKKDALHVLTEAGLMNDADELKPS